MWDERRLRHTDRDEKSSPLSFCVGDNTGDHISEKNCYYSELTGMYWVWKNSHAKVVGTCHYRRYLLNEQGKLFTEAQILSLLQQYDVITTKELQLNFSYYEGFASHHKILYLDETARVIQEIYPDYAADFQQLIYVLCLLILLFSHCCHSLIRSVDAQYFIMDFSCLSLYSYFIAYFMSQQCMPTGDSFEIFPFRSCFASEDPTILYSISSSYSFIVNL